MRAGVKKRKILSTKQSVVVRTRSLSGNLMIWISPYCDLFLDDSAILIHESSRVERTKTKKGEQQKRNELV